MRTQGQSRTHTDVDMDGMDDTSLDGDTQIHASADTRANMDPVFAESRSGTFGKIDRFVQHSIEKQRDKSSDTRFPDESVILPSESARQIQACKREDADMFTENMEKSCPEKQRQSTIASVRVE